MELPPPLKFSISAEGSGVLQGSVTGLVLFNFLIDHLELGVSNEVVISVDYMKFFGAVRTREDSEVLQKDLSWLRDLASKCKVKFKVGECKVLHVGGKNLKYK